MTAPVASQCASPSLRRSKKTPSSIQPEQPAKHAEDRVEINAYQQGHDRGRPVSGAFVLYLSMVVTARGHDCNRQREGLGRTFRQLLRVEVLSATILVA